MAETAAHESGPGGGCCVPAQGTANPPDNWLGRADSPGPAEQASATVTRTPDSPSAVLSGGIFLMGSDDPIAYPEDGESPVRPVSVAPFAIERHCVSNQRFAEFCDATGYVSQAERFGAAFVFAGLLPDDAPATRAVVAAPWWRQVPGASWRSPDGPWSSWQNRRDHPVVQVTWNDARAYCAWAGLRLATEAEWEFAARGGLEQQRFPWGTSLRPGGEHRMNVWQGRFPIENTTADGFYGTAPVDSYPPNGYGLYNMTGNVWEWTADRFVSPAESGAQEERRALRGGSYLCHSSYCRRYRVSARMGSTPDSASGNVGFRCVRDLIRDGG
jgi:sulfatase modifying factor 1